MAIKLTKTIGRHEKQDVLEPYRANGLSHKALCQDVDWSFHFFPACPNTAAFSMRDDMKILSTGSGRLEL